MTDSAVPYAQVGQVLEGKYRIERVLGRGGMGVVVEATHTKLDQRVAIKFLLPEVLSSAEVVERFAREARAAARVHSEHVARVLDVGQADGGAPYMVMELLEGQDLEHLLEARGPLPPSEAVGYVLEACEAVAEAHAQGIVHRDLKPANLFLHQRGDGTSLIKVCDFGISKLPPKGPEQAALTQKDAVIGSPYYMSPEQVRAAHGVDARSDVWSLGVILYELLSGAPPFRGPSVSAVVAAIVASEPERLDRVRAELPAGLADAVHRCLEKRPDDRFGDVGELARALAPFAPEHGLASAERIRRVLGASPYARTSSAPPPAPSSPLPSALPAGQSSAGLATSASSGSGRTRVLPLAIGLTVLALAAALASAGLLRRPSSSGRAPAGPETVEASAEPPPRPEPRPAEPPSAQAPSASPPPSASLGPAPSASPPAASVDARKAKAPAGAKGAIAPATAAQPATAPPTSTAAPSPAAAGEAKKNPLDVKLK